MVKSSSMQINIAGTLSADLNTISEKKCLQQTHSQFTVGIIKCSLVKRNQIRGFGRSGYTISVNSCVPSVHIHSHESMVKCLPMSSDIGIRIRTSLSLICKRERGIKAQAQTVIG